MVSIKYFDGVREAQRTKKPLALLPRFDLERLRTSGLGGKILGTLLAEPLWLLGLLRRFKPIARIGRFVLVTRNDDVRDILERQDEFETPYGPEMTELAEKANFILGMQDGPDYRRMKSAVLSAFPPDEVEAIVRPIARRHSQDIMMRAAPGFDVISGLLKIVPVRICRDYFGLLVEDEDRFADWSIAVSALLFSDPLGNPKTRELALVAADRLKALVDRSVEAVRDGRTSKDTPLGRLVGMVDSDRLKIEQLHSIMIGMVAGFGPTNLLAGGNCLDVILTRPDARDAVERALATNDNGMLERAIREAMRFKPIWIGPMRYVPRDTVIAKGTPRERLVKAKSIVMPATLSAMFDPEAVERPEEFDTNRSQRDYLIFGHGIHLCIGTFIAYVQIGEGLRALFAKPGLRRSPGKAGKLQRLGAYPETLKVDFDLPPLCRTVQHSMVTVVCRVTSGSTPDVVREKVAAFGNPATAAMQAALDASGVIHFASLAVAATGDDGVESADAAHLVLELSGDGDTDSVVDAFAKYAGPHLAKLFEDECEYVGGQDLSRFLREHAVTVSQRFGGSAGLVFSGTPSLSVERIRAEAELAEAVQAVVERPGRQTRSAAATLATVRHELQKSGKFAWAFQPAQGDLNRGPGSIRQALLTTFAARPILITLGIVVLAMAALTFHFVFGFHPGVVRNLLVGGTSLALAIIGLALLAAAAVGISFVALRRLEKRDVPSTEMIELGKLETIMDRENRSAQNHLTAISILKPGILRRAALRLTFYLISIAAQKVFRPGFLSNINTIHFARWVVVPRTRMLLFFSNYGGSWESYLEDFITKAASGLTGVWSNSVGFPKTRWLYLEGARDGDRFKRWARTQQVPTLFWYSAYPTLNTARIRINSRIRQGIAHADDSGARDWMSLFGSIPRPILTGNVSAPLISPPPPPTVETLEAGEIQSVFFTAFGRLEHAHMMAMSIPRTADRDKRKAWLEWLTGQVSFGESGFTERAMTVALGPEGLRSLGLETDPDHDPLGTFPSAFRQGMASATRARILDDVDKSAPDQWQWGSTRPVDMVLICYAGSAEDLEQNVGEIKKRARAASIGLVTELPLAIKRSGKRAVEHFGFVDGVSQPIVRGTARANFSVSPLHLVSPGEFLLGYRDEHGYYPPALTVAASQDRSGILPTVEGVAAPVAGDPELRDFGRNGSFLVVRQFEQHVEAFGDYCHKAAADHPDPEVTSKWVAAKMVGRWPDGSSLVRNPEGRPGQSADNDFTFGAEDPQGLRCPLGSHVRRSNPRDSLGDDHEAQIRIGKRHRILRVGRTYEKPRGRGKPEKGLLFMCLNADIERQYEFMQQTWVSSGSFHGLMAEKDPTIAEQNGGGRFSIPRWEDSVVLKGMPSFVTTKGGGYFFMPSRSALRYLASRL